MIPRHDDNLQMRITAVRLSQEAEKTTLRGCRRIGNIKDIAGNQQHVSLPLRQHPGQPSEKRLMLFIPVIPEEGLP